MQETYEGKAEAQALYVNDLKADLNQIILAISIAQLFQISRSDKSL
jgi:hypothetical protein